ncbi:MAG: hypothetical protein RR671_00515 [Raoultibacter sp.]
MSQRNPMNDRYQTDEAKGQTRKSAASAKPKTKAASSVHVESTKPVKKQGLMAKLSGGGASSAKPEAKKSSGSSNSGSSQGEYYNPPTAEYKRWRRIWWVLLIGAIAMTGISFGARFWFADIEVLSMITLAVAYVMIIAALFVDFVKIRKIRRNYQAEMESKKTKAAKAEAKKLAAEQAVAQVEAEAKAAEKAAKKGERNSIIDRIKGSKSSEGALEEEKATAAESTEEKGK